MLSIYNQNEPSYHSYEPDTISSNSIPWTPPKTQQELISRLLQAHVLNGECNRLQASIENNCEKISKAQDNLAELEQREHDIHIKEENAHLEGENARLKKENAHIKGEIAQQEIDNADNKLKQLSALNVQNDERKARAIAAKTLLAARRTNNK